MHHTILHNEREINFSIRVNHRARRIILKVSNEGDVTVTIPRKYLERQAIKLVQNKASWILGHQKRAERISESRPKVVDEIMFLGNKYPVEIFSNSRKIKLDFQTNKFTLNIGEHNYDDVRNELKKWYIKQSRKIIPNLIENFGYTNQINRIAIKGQKTCWGSCSGKSNLNFNWRLMMAPMSVVNYVVAHELTHLEHMDHSQRFWNKVQEKDPDFRKHKGWLREHGRLLKF